MSPALSDVSTIQTSASGCSHSDRQSADAIRDHGGALGAIEFASDDVAAHLASFRAGDLNLAPDAATKGEPLYNAKEKHKRLPFCSTPRSTWG